MHLLHQPSEVGTGLRFKSRRPYVRCRALYHEVAEIAAKGQVSFQETLVGIAVCSAVAASIYLGTKGEPVVCTLCQGNGGARCFGCEGAGTMEAKPKDFRGRSRDFTGRQDDLQKCNVCRGSGMVLCRQCGGTGFMKRF